MTLTAGGLPVGRPPVLWRAAGTDPGLVHQDQVPDARRQAGAFPSAGGEFRRRPGGEAERAMISAIETSPNGRFYPCSVTQNLLQCMSLELARFDVRCGAAIGPLLGAKRKSLALARNDVNDPGCVKTLGGITAPGILGPTVMRRAKKRKNLSSARHCDQIRFCFHTTKT